MALLPAPTLVRATFTLGLALIIRRLVAPVLLLRVSVRILIGIFLTGCRALLLVIGAFSQKDGRNFVTPAEASGDR